MDNSESKQQKNSKWLILLLLLITLVCICITVWTLFFRDKPTLAPDYAPQKAEEHAETIPDDSGGKFQSPDGGGSVSLTYSDQAVIDLSEETASLYFANPGKSNQDMVLQIVIQDTVLVQSGMLAPGNQVRILDLLDGAGQQLSPGGYEGKFAVFYYSPDSGEKAILNTEIPITISVNE